MVTNGVRVKADLKDEIFDLETKIDDHKIQIEQCRSKIKENTRLLLAVPIFGSISRQCRLGTLVHLFLKTYGLTFSIGPDGKCWLSKEITVHTPLVEGDLLGFPEDLGIPEINITPIEDNNDDPL